MPCEQYLLRRMARAKPYFEQNKLIAAVGLTHLDISDIVSPSIFYISANFLLAVCIRSQRSKQTLQYDVSDASNPSLSLPHLMLHSLLAESHA